MLFQLEKFVNKAFDICLTLIKLSQNDWLIKTNSSPIGEFIFILNTDWRGNNWILIHHFYKTKLLKELKILTISVTDQADFSQGVTSQGTFCHVVVFIANLS